MKARSLAFLVALLATLVAGCGTPGGDSGDNTKKAEESKKNSAKIDVAKAGPSRSRSGTRRSAAARRSRSSASTRRSSRRTRT
jgi:hypothetical protein